MEEEKAEEAFKELTRELRKTRKELEEYRRQVASIDDLGLLTTKGALGVLIRSRKALHEIKHLIRHKPRNHEDAVEILIKLEKLLGDLDL